MFLQFSSDQWLEIIKILASVVGGGILVALWQYYLERKKQFSSDNSKIKRDIYASVVEQIAGAYAYNNTIQLAEEEVKLKQLKLVDSLIDFYKRGVLYGSPRVMSAFGNLMQQSFELRRKGETNEPQVALLAADLLRAMRKDIGLSNRGLGKGGRKLLRPMVWDYNDSIKNLKNLYK